MLKILLEALKRADLQFFMKMSRFIPGSAEKEDNGWNEFFMPLFINNVSMFAIIEPK
ncbi:MAG: hypothetical protein AB2L24_31835 [Mangrovibacterium sp.]